MRKYYVFVPLLAPLIPIQASAQGGVAPVRPAPVEQPAALPSEVPAPNEPEKRAPRGDTETVSEGSSGAVQDRLEERAEGEPAAIAPGADRAPLDAASPEGDSESALDSDAAGESAPVSPPEESSKEPPPDSEKVSESVTSQDEVSAKKDVASEGSANAPSAPEYKFSGAPGKGATFEFGDQFSLNVRARIQVRYQLDLPPEDETGAREPLQTVNIGTARLWFSGHAFTPDLTYMVQLAVAARDYRDGATSPVYDAFIDYRAHRDFSLKVGQYFVPFDRLRTVREFALQMGDRPVPVQQLTLDRDVGITAYSDNFLADNSPLAVRIGAFGGAGIHQTASKEPGALVVGRVELRPLGKLDDDSEGDLERRVKPALALGAAVARNWNTNRVRSTTGATYAEGTVDYLHAAADLVFKWRGIALQGELLVRDADSDTVEDATGAPVGFSQSGRGWVAQASYTFDPPFEIVGRASGLYALGGTDPAFAELAETSGREVGAGLNYYINGHKAKIQTDWIARFPGDYDFAESQHTAHVQLDMTF
jgi:hypothetical protein